MNCKKMLCTVPMIMALSTPAVISPITALAAEKTTTNTVSQVKSVKGYVYKNGVRSTVYENPGTQKSDAVPTTPGLPTLPADPLAGLPSEGTTVLETGDMGDILYFAGDSEYKLSGGKKAKYYLKKLSNGEIEFGGYDPDTFQLVAHGNNKGNSITENALNIQFPNNPNFKNAFDGKTKVKRETRYKLINSITQDSVSTGVYNHKLVSGVSTADQFGFSATLGWKVGTTIGGGILPASVTAEMSGSLSGTYGHTITVTSSEEVGRSVSVGKVDNPAYKYKQYRMAGYQLKSQYSVLPGSGLQAIINQNPQLKSLASRVYEYSENDLYVGVTPGSHLQ